MLLEWEVETKETPRVWQGWGEGLESTSIIRAIF
jgi:hypothetical protein